MVNTPPKRWKVSANECVFSNPSTFKLIQCDSSSFEGNYSKKWKTEKEQGTSIKGKIRLVPVSDEEKKTIYEGSSAILRNLKHPTVLNVSVRTFPWQSVTVTVGQSRLVFRDKPADSEDWGDWRQETDINSVRH